MLESVAIFIKLVALALVVLAVAVLAVDPISSGVLLGCAVALTIALLT